MPAGRRAAEHIQKRPGTSAWASGAGLLVIVLAAVAAFLPAAGNEFVDWDDFQGITRNEHIRRLSAENLYWMATTGHLGEWQPIGWLAVAVQYQLFNGQNETAFSHGMHVTSIGLHALASGLCFLVLRRLLRLARPETPSGALGAAALLATLIFAVHPLRVELVAWATAQPYILALLGCLATVWCYLQAATGGRRGWLVASWICLAAALMCKPVGVPLVAVLLLLDWYPLRRLGGEHGWFRAHVRRIWLEKLPYALTAAAVVAIAPLVKGGARSTMPLAVHGGVERLAQACYGLIFYVYKTLWPTNLSPIYELRLPLDYTAPRYVLAAVLVVAAAVLLIIFRRRFRAGVAAAASYVLLLSPVLGFLQSGNQEVADRYGYLPCIAWSALLAGGWLMLWQRRGQRWLKLASGGLGIAAILACAALTWRQCGIWRTTATLWTHAAAMQSDSSLAQNGYGYVLLQQGQVDEAVARFRRAIAIKTDNDVAHYNLWNALRTQGKTEELAVAYRNSIHVFPNDPEPYCRLGNLFFQGREYVEAISQYRAALARQPDHAGARAALAGALYATGDNTGAIREARRVLETTPTSSTARHNLALALKAEGRTPEAIAELRELLRRDPQNTGAQRLLERWSQP